MSNHQSGIEQTRPPRIPRLIHRFPVLVILAWLGIIFLMSVAVPPLEQVAEQRQVSLSPKDAPSVSTRPPWWLAVR
jgi:putative drug exporter of the RND superfamily